MNSNYTFDDTESEVKPGEGFTYRTAGDADVMHEIKLGVTVAGQRRNVRPGMMDINPGLVAKMLAAVHGGDYSTGQKDVDCLNEKMYARTQAIRKEHLREQMMHQPEKGQHDL